MIFFLIAEKEVLAETKKICSDDLPTAIKFHRDVLAKTYIYKVRTINMK